MISRGWLSALLLELELEASDGRYRETNGSSVSMKDRDLALVAGAAVADDMVL